MDGTGVRVYSERHCPQCLTRTHDGQTLYYTMLSIVLEHIGCRFGHQSSP